MIYHQLNFIEKICAASGMRELDHYFMARKRNGSFVITVFCEFLGNDCGYM